MTDKPTVADYKLGQTLIFTSLTQASAAADLWGKDSLDGAVKVEDYPLHDKDWHKGFATSFIFDGWEKVLIEFNIWRIILDTEEKVQWFVPQVGDFCWNGHIASNQTRLIAGVISQIDRTMATIPCSERHNGKRYFCEELRSLEIMKRHGNPFPTPQDVIEPEEKRND